MGGGKGGTSTSTVTIPPEVLARYNAVNATAEDIGKTPFQAYSQDPSAFVAQTNAVQNSGINNIYNAQNSAQPWFQQAGNTYAQGAQGASPFNQMASSNINNALAAGVPLTMQGAMPVNAQQFSQQGVDQYMNPYMNDVIKGTLAPLQQQQQMDQSKLTGNAIGSGAFGGDRAGLAQAALMGQQQIQAAVQPVLGRRGKVHLQQLVEGAVLKDVPVQPPFAARIDQPADHQNLQHLGPRHRPALVGQPTLPEPVQFQLLPQPTPQPAIAIGPRPAQLHLVQLYPHGMQRVGGHRLRFGE